MENNNVTTFILLGFPALHGVRILFFLLILIIYLTTVCVNLMVITLVSHSRKLHTPMYFFLTQLTISDIMTSSDIVPNMLHMVLRNSSSMSISQCFTQFFVFGASETSECLLLTAMSYDRFLAICRPLHYDSIMNSSLCLKLIIASWTLGFFVSSCLTINMLQLSFCQSDVINHFFCDFAPILKLSCSNTLKVKTLSTILSLPIIFGPFLIVVISYAYIVHTIIRIQSINHRQKAFSTCCSHLTVLSIFYGTLVSTYLGPVTGKSNTPHKILSLVYTVLTPLTNPVIYCLRNKDIKEVFQTIHIKEMIIL